MFGIHLILWCVLFSFGQCSEVNVRTQLGEIIGERTNVTFLDIKYQVDRYLGIPYAKPPVDNLRFKKPEPAEPFEEPYYATTFGAICQQLDMMQWPSKFVKSEDCLFLNIYVPNQASDQPTGHAVMFFIHGGALSFGTGNFYPGEVLSSVGNVIVVTINYRLGLFGFLDMNDKRAQGNFGFWDQHEALKWVNQNIEAFGGDKDRVTIFGQSAGSSSVTFQMLYPLNKGLFKNAIVESGTALMPFPLTNDTNTAAKNFAEAAKCSTESTDEILDCLMSMPGDKPTEILIDAMKSGDFADQMKFVTMPTLDGDFIKRSATDLQEASLTGEVEEVEFCRSINLINGVNEAEGALYILSYGNMEELEHLQISRNQMNNEVIPGIFSMVFGFDHVLPQSVKKMIISEYTDWTGPNDPLKLRHEVVRLNGDINYNIPGVAFSLLHSNSTTAAATYMYKFTALVDLPLVESPSWNAKANHGDELGPVFGYNFDYKEMYNLTEYQVPAWELDLSSRIMTYWSNFAKSSDPNLPTSSTQAAGPWPRYTVDDQKYMVLDKEESTGKFLFAKEHDFWKTILPKLLEVLESSKGADSCTD
ncbi:Carboxylesterase 4A [Mactra antiquata]